MCPFHFGWGADGPQRVVVALRETDASAPQPCIRANRFGKESP
jgi:hypothetical protein